MISVTVQLTDAEASELEREMITRRLPCRVIEGRPAATADTALLAAHEKLRRAVTRARMEAANTKVA